MVTPREVKARAEKLEDENIEFRSFLKFKADEDELDAHFLRLHKELFADYDCSKCGNCCREYRVGVNKDEAAAIADFLGLSVYRPTRTVAKYAVDAGAHRSLPCSF